jgi:hypothetical protein
MILCSLGCRFIMSKLIICWLISWFFSHLSGAYIHKYAIFGTDASEMVKTRHIKVIDSRSARCMEMHFFMLIQSTLRNKFVAGILICRWILSSVKPNFAIQAYKLSKFWNDCDRLKIVNIAMTLNSHERESHWLLQASNITSKSEEVAERGRLEAHRSNFLVIFAFFQKIHSPLFALTRFLFTKLQTHGRLV